MLAGYQVLGIKPKDSLSHPSHDDKGLLFLKDANTELPYSCLKLLRA